MAKTLKPKEGEQILITEVDGELRITTIKKRKPSKAQLVNLRPHPENLNHDHLGSTEDSRTVRIRAPIAVFDELKAREIKAVGLGRILTKWLEENPVEEDEDDDFEFKEDEEDRSD